MFDINALDANLSTYQLVSKFGRDGGLVETKNIWTQKKFVLCLLDSVKKV